jgi:hypothetical protein
MKLYRELNVLWGKKLHIEWWPRKERSGVAWLLAGVWQLKGTQIKEDAPYVWKKRTENTLYWDSRVKLIND